MSIYTQYNRINMKAVISKKPFVVAALIAFGAASSLLIYLGWRMIGPGKSVCPKCNIIMIDIDILRADALPCYGYKRNTAPNICAFGTLSQMFTNNYAQSNWTLPSMFSTITSLYPSSHGVLKSFRDALDPSTPTLAQILKNSGYQTFYFGTTNQLTISDINGGTKGYDEINSDADIKTWPQRVKELIKVNRPFFAHFYISRLHMPYTLKNEKQLIEPMSRPKGFPITLDEFSVPLGTNIYQGYQQIFTAKSISEHSELFTNMNTTNIPGMLKYYKSVTNPLDPTMVNEGWWSVIYDTYLQLIKQNEQKTRPYIRLLYDSILSLLDKDVAQILNVIRSSKLAKNTIVVIYSDHGEEFGEHGRYNHLDSLYNEITNTPLIIYVPTVPPQKFRWVTQNIDIFPTLTELIGVDVPKTLQGSSLIPLIQNKPYTDFKFAISQTDSGKAAIRSNTWKLIVNNFTNPTVNTELYNLLEDPEEKYDMSELQKGVRNFLLSELSKRVRY